MGLKIKNPRGFGQYLEQRLKNLKQGAINNLIYVGEAAVKEARERGRYKDRTGNLRSSIGYCVLDEGKVISMSSFPSERGTYQDEKGKLHSYDGKQGSQEGRKFLKSLISRHSKGLVLIVVAGMEYAQYVEAMNLNVIDSAEQKSEKLLPILMRRLKI